MNDVILSRIAEALTWTGRYVERADATGRILDAYLHRMLEDPWRDEDAACRSLYAILGVDAGDERVDMQQVLDQLAFDAHSTCSIEGALGAARLNARSAREAVSSEMWECLNATWHALGEQRRAARRTGPYAYLELVRSRAALFFGLADSTMSRDDSWRFVVLGRSLERVDMTVRLLSVRVLDAAHAPDWTTLLSASGADEAYARVHTGFGDSPRVAEFLLLDRAFPRSALHALTTAEECLTALGRPRQDPARRPIGRIRTRLEYLDSHALEEQLPLLLTDLRQSCMASAEAVAERFFPYQGPVEWAQEGA
ncbi:alpha-E domain-containing protein [Streptomyces sp. NBC_00457]|uniref:alpha-E domain-containing protein n=1 Tax=unclassified Streptomyces TaxID=2593676 RepID=UPI002E1CCCA2|nr:MULTISPECIES: alpha-E domain-containing protein [unclassified Streptomyces]